MKNYKLNQENLDNILMIGGWVNEFYSRLEIKQRIYCVERITSLRANLREQLDEEIIDALLTPHDASPETLFGHLQSYVDKSIITLESENNELESQMKNLRSAIESAKQSSASWEKKYMDLKNKSKS